MQPSEFIQALPKAELHLHIEGALPWEMVQAQVKAWPSPPPWWAADYRFDNFGHFAQIIRHCYENTLTSVENYHLAAQGIFKSLAAQNVRYVELSFSLGYALSQQLPLAEIVAAIKQAAPAPLIVRVFCGISRSWPHLLQGNLLETVLNLPELEVWIYTVMRMPRDRLPSPRSLLKPGSAAWLPRPTRANWPDPGPWQTLLTL